MRSQSRWSPADLRLVLAGSAVLFLLALFATPAAAQLGPMPEPPENPLTPEKALLGKFLFWDEQLSADDSVACGTCHQPLVGGSDPRVMMAQSMNPGADGSFNTDDDVHGSIGIVFQECDGTRMDDGTFYPERQVTNRRSPSFIGAGYAPDLFWDGHAPSEFTDPETNTVAIASGGGLESQAIAPIISSVEMGCDNRTWADVETKLENVVPLALGDLLPPDLEDALAQFPTYPDLFQNAFGTPEITARRIAFAIASYERTLVPDQTPYDLYLGGDTMALTANQQAGLTLFEDHCSVCHDGVELTDNDFHNTGLRPVDEDLGRELVTGDDADRGKFKTPDLRNVALHPPFFHNGGKATLDDVLAFYNDGGDFTDNLDPEMVPLGLTNQELLQIKDFIENGLTDPRVEDELYPFSRPQLQVFFQRGDANSDGVFDLADAIHMLDYLFTGGIILDCEDAADANDDGVLNLADPIAMLTRLFQGGAPLPLPGDDSLGPDPTPDGLDCRL